MTHEKTRALNDPMMVGGAGTQDRIVMITGDPDRVSHAVSLVVEHLHTNAVNR